jgi:hypothetical protein
MFVDKWLQEAKTKKRKTPIKDTQIYQGCVYTWNAYRNGKPVIENIKFDVSKGFNEAE